MVNREELTALLERVRAATGPDRELDGRIDALVAYDGKQWPAAYTASIDAALALTERLSPIGTMSSHSLNHSIARDGEEFWAFHVTYYHEDGHPPTFFCETANDAPSAIIGCALSALIAQAETP